MNISFIPSDKSGLFQKIIGGLIDEAQSFDWAVAFGQHSAFTLLEGEFTKFFKRGGRSRAVFDLSSGLTDPSLIEELATYPGESFCKVFCGGADAVGIFHHKIYIFRSGEMTKALIGSLNFSQSAFYKNYESCVLVEGESTDSFISSLINHFENDIWNSPSMISPEAAQEILEIYRQLHTRNNRGRLYKQKTAKKLKDVLNELAENQFYQQGLNIQIAYLMGLICASAYNLQTEELERREINLKFKSALKNRDNEDEGFICARVEDQLLGDIRLPQYPAQTDTLKRIVRELGIFLSWDSNNNSIEYVDNSKKQTNIDIKIKFSEESKIFNTIEKYIDKFEIEGEKYLPIIPEDILEAKDVNIQQHFLRGYFDFRSRISKSDRYPGERGKLRVAIQIGTKDLKFANQLNDILTNKYDIEAQYSDGSARGKDNMIRMLPSDDLLKFWSTGYDKLMISAFIDYNNSI